MNTDRTRYGGDITYKYKNFLIEGEFLAGSDESDSLALLERNGYYVTVGYTPIKDKLQVITRLDNCRGFNFRSISIFSKLICFLIAGILLNSRGF